MRRKSSILSGGGDHASAHDSNSKEDEARIEKEITEIDKHYDFDVPSAIDWDLLIVNSDDQLINISIERDLTAKRGEAIQQATL